MRPAIGVLALQGAVEPQRAAFARLGLAAREVRAPAELAGLTHLVLPGGESTTLARLLRLFGLWEPIARFHARGELCLLGTCAGAILLARDCGGTPPTLGLLDVQAERNAYGTQVDSGTRALTLAPELGGGCLQGVFIRAPRFLAPGPAARVLARDGHEPVALAGEDVLATTFHPELSGDDRLHAWFASRVPRALAAAAPS
jgi:5'-phosphate synthase pdxT subunit